MRNVARRKKACTYILTSYRFYNRIWFVLLKQRVCLPTYFIPFYLKGEWNARGLRLKNKLNVAQSFF